MIDLLAKPEEIRARFYKEVPDYLPSSKEIEDLVLVAFAAGYNAAVIDQTKASAAMNKVKTRQ
jgi:hypothetical protein